MFCLHYIDFLAQLYRIFVHTVRCSEFQKNDTTLFPANGIAKGGAWVHVSPCLSINQQTRIVN